MTEPKLYHIGTLEGCPLQNVTVGGVCFPRYTEEVSHNEDSNVTTRSRRNGDIVPLSDSQRDFILKRMGSRVVRWNGSRTRGRVITVESERFNPNKYDDLLSNYLFMREVPNTAASFFGEKPASIGSMSVLEEEAKESSKASERAARATKTDKRRRKRAKRRRVTGDPVDPLEELK